MFQLPLSRDLLKPLCEVRPGSFSMRESAQKRKSMSFCFEFAQRPAKRHIRSMNREIYENEIFIWKIYNHIIVELVM